MLDDAKKELSYDVIVNHYLAMYLMTTAKRKLKIILKGRNTSKR